MQIEQGDASPMERDNDGATPAHFAAARGTYFAHVRYRRFFQEFVSKAARQNPKVKTCDYGYTYFANARSRH